MKKVELLSPAGGYETMVGAFNAGADAVYLGGQRFGARAYADNFDTQQVLDAIFYAHLHGKKIYLTVNTLVKQREFASVYDFMLPYAEAGLDGVIVQDYGVMRLIRDEFPDIELHASTQQTVTGVYGAKMLKDLGCVRVVPARELSLSEMSAIRHKADIEVEAFIHGAMCYCYSGACLFSSMVGGRSGNRGRCAQPCRLTYGLDRASGEKSYPLSLKDMCTINMLPQLIEAGIDSFKIEGRMKKPEYSAGVTAMYRKYIDLYYDNPAGNFAVSDADIKMLSSLYIRSGISDGYYHRHNGREMVTLSSPAYTATSDELLEDIREKYLRTKLKIKCRLNCCLAVGKKAVLTMEVLRQTPDTANIAGDNCAAEIFSVTGGTVQEAQKKPMDEESVKKQLAKLGNTSFEAEEIEVIIDDNGTGRGIFIPISELNELRRELCEKAEKELTVKNSKAFRKLQIDAGNDAFHMLPDKDYFHILVSTSAQLKTVLKRLRGGAKISRVYVDINLFLQLEKEETELIKNSGCEFIVALSYITREERFDGTTDIQSVLSKAENYGFSGVLVRNLEQLGFIRERKYNGRIITDYCLYVWNAEAALLLKEMESCEISMPLELNIHEASEAACAIKENLDVRISYNVYGRAPMMISAGCIKKTLDKCSGQQNRLYKEQLNLYDRLGNELKVETDCRNCLNVIWNAHTTSLIDKLDSIRDRHLFDALRIDFTTEDGALTDRVLDAFLRNKGRIDSGETYTAGHYRRGAE